MILINNIYNKLRNNAGALYPYLLVFTAAFVLRFIAWKIFGTYFSLNLTDSVEYYINSINFEPLDVHKVFWGYDYWYERTPLYVIFLHIIHREIIWQIVLSSAGAVLMFRLNKTAGLIWIIYPQEIIYSFQYCKETLLLFLVILLINIFRKRRYLLTGFIPLLILGFVSYAGVFDFNHGMSKGFMSNFWNLWKPAFNVSIVYSKGFVYLQAVPYTILMFYFLRHCKITSTEFALFIILSFIYSIIYAEPRYREPFMPLLFLFCAPAVENAYYRLRNIIFNKQKFDFKGIFKKYILHPSA